MSDALQVKGFAWLNLLHFIQERHARDVDALVAAFPAHKAQFNSATVLPISSVPGALHIGVVKWMVDRHYGGTTDGARQFGRALAERNVSSTFRSFQRLEDLKVALTSTERAFSQFYSRGHMKLTLIGHALDAHLSDFPDANPVFGNVLGAGLVAFLRAGHIEGNLTQVNTGPDWIHYQVDLVSLPISSPTPVPFK